MSNSVQSHRPQPTRLPHPWDSPGKNTGVGCHFLLQCMKVESESKVAQLCLTLRDPMDRSPPGPSVHGIFRATVLDWGAIAFSNVWHEVPTNQCSGGPNSADSMKEVWCQRTRVICLLSGPWNPGLKQDNPVEVNLSVLHAIWSTPCLVVEGWRGPREHPGNQDWGPCGSCPGLGYPTHMALLALGDPKHLKGN